jgi:hypothetical protein
MKVVKLAYGQSLYDLAVQEFGHEDGVFLIFEDNPNIVFDFSQTPPAGTDVLIRDIPVLTDGNRAVAAEIARREKLIVSGNPANYNPISLHYAEDGYWDDDYSV